MWFRKRKIQNNTYVDLTDPAYPVIRVKIPAKQIEWKWKKNRLTIIIDGVDYTPSTIKNIPNLKTRNFIRNKLPTVIELNAIVDRLLATQ
ncbi:hypothetical protein LCGC14_0194950 [marine sediment metagenome]|uniref:Uncharacterized protein n=1 Tax=marine sediment metagenome TaxID=412755 RepID=A0A0F9XN86_9ZZZZ